MTGFIAGHSLAGSLGNGLSFCDMENNGFTLSFLFVEAFFQFQVTDHDLPVGIVCGSC
jgi:hypothetical protein